jgi:hypothetical protein
MISSTSILRLRETLAEKRMPYFVLATEMRKYGCKLSPSDVSKIVRGIQIPSVGERTAISAVLGKPVSFLWPEDSEH